jgi:hypothetical protein
LLDLRERARILAIVWYAFGFVHMTAIALVPSLRERMFELQRTLQPSQTTPVPLDLGMVMSVTFGFTAIFMAVVVWFLVRDRAAFVPAENP